MCVIKLIQKAITNLKESKKDNERVWKEEREGREKQ